MIFLRPNKKSLYLFVYYQRIIFGLLTIEFTIQGLILLSSTYKTLFPATISEIAAKILMNGV